MRTKRLLQIRPDAGSTTNENVRKNKMSVIHSIPGRIRFSAGSEAGYRLIKEKAGEIMGSIDIRIYIRYNIRTGRGLMVFIRDERVTRVLSDMIEILSKDLGDLVRDTDESKIISEQRLSEPEHPFLAILKKVVNHYATRLFMPPGMRPVWCIINVAPLIWEGLKALTRARLDVSVLDAAAVLSALFMKDFNTAGTIHLLMDISETLELWTQERSKQDLSGLLTLDKTPVWVMRRKAPEAIAFDAVAQGDLVVVRAGGKIPVDGVVADGLAMVNQVSMTGEAAARKKKPGSQVYAGTIIEEGRLIILAEAVGDQTRFAKIANILAGSDEVKAEIHSKAEKLADKIVPFSFLFAGIVWAATRDFRKAAAILMADYSCAIKIATPLSVRTAMMETARNGAVVKGGRYLETLSKLDAVVLDKTGTLTKAVPQVVKVCPVNGFSREFVLRQAACMEEHFPHPIAEAVIRKARQEGLDHAEDHAEVEYILAHGIATTLNGQRTVLGSRHFIHEDEGISLERAEESIQECMAKGLSLLYFACGGKLAGVIAVQDPIREDAPDFIRRLKARKMKHIVMLTGDGPESARRVAEKLGIDEYHAQVMPEEKTAVIHRLQNKGYSVAMVGDGINDAAALSCADIGVSLKNGADIAKETCNLILTGQRLDSLLRAMTVSDRAMTRIRRNFIFIVSSNTLFIGLGITGMITPAVMALLHNMGTVLTCLSSMRPLLKESS